MKQKEMFCWNSPAFSMIQWMLATWSPVPLSFLNPGWTSGSSYSCMVEVWLGEFWVFASVWDECNCVVVWTTIYIYIFGIAFLKDWNEHWSFPVLWPLLSCQPSNRQVSEISDDSSSWSSSLPVEVLDKPAPLWPLWSSDPQTLWAS